MLITFNKAFNKLLQKYFDKIKNKKFFKKLGKYEKVVNLSMQSQYFYQKGQYDEAESYTKQCVNEAKSFLISKTQRNNGWMLIKKSLKNNKDIKKARAILENILQNIQK